MMAALMATMLPTMILSGFIFPDRQHAGPLQVLCRLLPATHFLVVLRGIMLRGRELVPAADGDPGGQAVCCWRRDPQLPSAAGVGAMRVLRTLVRKEFRQLRRDKALLRLVLVLPMIQLLVLSYALNNDLRNVRVGVLDEDRTPLSRASSSTPSRQSDVVRRRARPPPAATTWARLLQRRPLRPRAAIPAGFARDVAAGPLARARAGTSTAPTAASPAAAPATPRPITREAARLARPRRRGRHGGGDPWCASSTTPSWRAACTWCRAIIVMLVTIISALVTGMAVVREKELGTLEQLHVTPLTPLQFIAGKTLPFALIALVDLVAGDGLRHGLVPRAA